MMNCIPNADGLSCRNCGWVKPPRIQGWPHRNCPNSPDLSPAAERLGVSLSDVRHYAGALAKWTKAGFPTREQAEVERIEAICKACDKYADGRCKQCGCRVNTGPAVVNKIKMATENCPLGKW